jgi:signal transduction histidine kinase/ligand-binding sensor domain-containing protein/DNA-binding response OmpR family regulator
LPLNIFPDILDELKIAIFDSGMSKMKSYFLFLLLIVLPGMINQALCSNAKSNLRFQYLTTDEGLAQNTVDCIFQDSYGFMWFGTWNGLCRYDGYKFRTFQKGDTPKSIPDNFVRAICEDTSGNLWIGTSNGVEIYNLKKESFGLPAGLQPMLEKIAVTSLFCDNKGGVWIAGEKGNLYYVTQKPANSSVDFDCLKMDVQKLQEADITYVYGLRNGRIIIGTSMGLYEVVSGQLQKLSFNGAQSALLELVNIHCIYESTNGDLWFGTEAGLFRYRQTSGLLSYYTTQPNNKNSLAHAIVMAIAEESTGTILVGTLGGVCFFDPATSEISRISGRLDEHETLNNEFVNSLFTDRDGNVWIGTEKGGVNKYSMFQKPFYSLRNHPDDSNSLSNNTINSILSDGDILWIGTAGGGLNRLDQQSGKFDHYTHSVQNANSICSNFISSICLTPEKQLWVSSWGDGFGRLVSASGKTFKNYLNVPGNQNSLVNSFVSEIYSDDRGFLLVGTFGGLDLFNPKTEYFFHFQQKLDKSLAIPAVGCILKDKKDFYWIGSQKGLFHIPARLVVPTPDKLVSGDYEFFTNTPGDSLSLSGNYVISLLEDKKGTVWIGTYGNGICKVIPSTDGKIQFKTYTTANGLCNDVIYSMEEDRSGNIWISTDNGLSKFNPEKLTFQNFYIKDGLLNDQFYWNSSSSDEKGNLYFGGINGVNYFNPEKIEFYPRLPKIVFTDFQVFNQSVKIGEKLHGNVVLEKSVAETKELELSYKDNVFSIEFSALDYFLPDKITYAYKMEGVDQNWVNVTPDRRFATYTNLSGGKYRFMVKASNSDGLWSTEPTVLILTIKPPFWQTNWFRLVAVLALAFSVMAYIRYRTRFLHEQKRKLEIQVRERTTQIEEQKEKLREQSESLQRSNHELADRQILIEGQKIELENQNKLIGEQRDEVIELNKKVSLINQLRLRFFTNISHEFRTPLTLIIDPLELLLKKLEGDQESIQTLKLINRNAQRLLHLINQLMNFRRIETGKIEIRVAQGDLTGFLKEIFVSFQDLANHQKINYSYITENEQKSCWFDPEKIENIFYNLLSNAFKFTPENGQISMQIKFTGPEQEQSGLSFPHIHVEISDTGKGIAEEHLPYLFDRFYQAESTADNRQKGSGIGLALTQELVQAMHGRISVESKINHGSKFTVKLPYRREDFSENELDLTTDIQTVNLQSKVEVISEEILHTDLYENQEPLQIDKSKPLILIVEDNYDLRNFIMHSMNAEYRVIGAENGKEGFELAKKYTPDLIISDIMMPVMDGLELCSRLKKELHTSHIPVILLTAKAMIEHWIEGLETGADDYIPKPFNLKVLHLKIANLIESRKRLRLLYSQGNNPSPEESTSNQIDQQFMAKAYLIIEKYLKEEEFSVDQFAREMMVSKSLLFKKIKALTGYSIVDFVNMFKLRKAASRLAANPQLNISEIAFEVGFNDPKYFSRIFRKVFGVTPSEYTRTLHKSGIIQEN